MSDDTNYNDPASRYAELNEPVAAEMTACAVSRYLAAALAPPDPYPEILVTEATSEGLLISTEYATQLVRNNSKIRPIDALNHLIHPGFKVQEGWGMC